MLLLLASYMRTGEIYLIIPLLSGAKVYGFGVLALETEGIQVYKSAII